MLFLYMTYHPHIIRLSFPLSMCLTFKNDRLKGDGKGIINLFTNLYVASIKVSKWLTASTIKQQNNNNYQTSRILISIQGKIRIDNTSLLTTACCITHFVFKIIVFIPLNLWDALIQLRETKLLATRKLSAHLCTKNVVK